jgi:hypothetical protein
MGGAVVRKEPATTALLEHYPAAYQIFEQAGWLNYFRRLQGYNEQQVLQFAEIFRKTILSSQASESL